jgi:hypothetical protein
MSPLRAQGGGCGPVWGFADLHTHPASFLGFGADRFTGENGMMWGKPAHDFASSGGCSPWFTLPCTAGLDLETSDSQANLESDLAPCPSSSGFPFACGFGFTHNNRVGNILLGPIMLCADIEIVSKIDQTSPGWTHQTGGYPIFSADNANGWQAALTVDHQLMHIDNIHRAYLGGLRLMFAAAVDNEVIKDLWTQWDYTPKPMHDKKFDVNSASMQLTYITNLANANRKWMQIVKTPAEARAAINSNKLAVVLSLEMDSLSLLQIQDLVAGFGVAHVIPVHLADNQAFGGTAIFSDVFNGLSNFINGPQECQGNALPGECPQWDPNVTFNLSTQVQTLQPGPSGLGWAPSPSTPTPGPVQIPGQINKMDLVGCGDFKDLSRCNFLALMKMGLLLDIAHMGQTSATTALDLAEKYNYPLMDSHTGLRCDSPNPTTGFPAFSCVTPWGTVSGGPAGATPAVINERSLPVSQLAVIQQLGGVIGLGEVPCALPTQASKIGNNTTAATPFVVPDPTLAASNPGPCATEESGAWVYFQGTDNTLWKVRNDGSQLSNICNNTTAATPFVAQLPMGGRWVYFEGTDNALWKVNDNGNCSSQYHIGENMPAGKQYTKSTPFVVPDPNSGAWIYYQGTDNTLWKIKDDGSQQSNICNNTTAATPFVASLTDGRWVYFEGTDNALWKVKDDGNCSSQYHIGENMPAGKQYTSSTPFVVPDPNSGAWIYYRGTDNTLSRIKDDGSQLSNIGNNKTVSTPFVVSQVDGTWVYFQGPAYDYALWKVRDDGSRQYHIGENDPTAGNQYLASAPFVTPDGWVYFQGTDNTLWKAPSIVVNPDPVTTWINGYAQALFLMGGRNVALGTDTDGLSPLIQQDVIPTQYPFTLNFGCPSPPTNCSPQQLSQYTFGARTLNFQNDGIANYGLLPDFIQAASQQRPGFMGDPSDQQIPALFHSAEDTIEMWEKVLQKKPQSPGSDYDQTATGTLNIDISSATQFGVVRSLQPVIVGGTLNIVLLNGFVPTIGQTFHIVVAPLVTGAFSTVNGAAINAAEHFVMPCSNSGVDLVVAPGPLP